jgi:hypothetical protein
MLPNAQPKPKPQLLDKRAREREWQAIDKAESTKVRLRSGGRCEVIVHGVRCNRRVRGSGILAGVHHHKGGWRLRGRFASALAENKTYACHQCHQEITGHVLQHVSGTRYRSVT